MSGTPSTPLESSPGIVSRRVGAGIQARLAKLQGAAGAAVIAREIPKKFPNGYDEPFKERLDGTLRRSLSSTWSSHPMETDTSAASTDGSHTLVDSQLNTALPAVNEEAELKRRQDFTKNWKEQQAANQLPSPEPSRVQSSPQPIIEEPEPEEEPTNNKPQLVVEPEPEPKEAKNGILTPPMSEPSEPSEPEPKPAPKPAPKPEVKPAPCSPAKALVARPRLSAPPTVPQTPPRLRPRASAPVTPSRPMLPPPSSRSHLAIPSPAKLTPPRPHTSMSSRRSSAPERRVFSSKLPEKVIPPLVRPRAISKIYEGPTLSSLAKQRPCVSSRLSLTRAASRTSCL